MLVYAAVLLALLAAVTTGLVRVLDLDISLRLPTPGAPLFVAALGGYLLAYWLHVWLDGYRPWDVRRW